MMKLKFEKVINKQATSTDLDEGLRSFMLSVYNYLGGGLAVSALTAYLTLSALSSQNYGLVNFLFESFPVYALILPQVLVLVVQGAKRKLSLEQGAGKLGNLFLFFLVLRLLPAIFYPLAIIFILRFKINSLSLWQVQGLFWVFVATKGVSLSMLALIYELQSIVQVLMITALVFLATSIYGYTTKRNLMQWRTYLLMALIGSLVLLLISIFYPFSSTTDLGFSAFGVLLFIAFTAYDTQRIKLFYLQGRSLPAISGEMIKKSAVYGAINIYLDFILLFQFLLRLLGRRS